jgi:hypothetical protein
MHPFHLIYVLIIADVGVNLPIINQGVHPVKIDHLVACL